MKLLLPQKFFKDIPYQKENEALAGFLVPLVLYTSFGAIWVLYQAYTSEMLLLGIGIVLFVIVLVFGLVKWISSQIDLLTNLRKTALSNYKNAQNNEQKEYYRNELKRLCVEYV
ncbi:hypothetical protein IJU97_06535 [bacterium]|nr:hypothetical protein [bacterium]